MANKDIPDWMMDYVANIDNEECYKDFQKLSKQYHDEMGDHQPKTSPALNLELHPYREGTNRKFTEKNPEHRGGAFIDEKFKRKSLELAEKYGYERSPDDEAFKKEKLNQARENNMTGQKSRTYEDFVAEKAHADYKRKNPDKSNKSQENKKKYRARELRKNDPDRFYKQAQQEFNKKQDKFEDMRSGSAVGQASNPQKSPQPEKPPEPNKTETPSKPQDKNTDDLKIDKDPKPSSRYEQTVNVSFKNNEKEDKQPSQEKSEPEPSKDEPQPEKQDNKEQEQPDMGEDNNAPSSRYFDAVGYEQNKSDILSTPPTPEPNPTKDNEPDKD